MSGPEKAERGNPTEATTTKPPPKIQDGVLRSTHHLAKAIVSMTDSPSEPSFAEYLEREQNWTERFGRIATAEQYEALESVYGNSYRAWLSDLAGDQD